MELSIPKVTVRRQANVIAGATETEDPGQFVSRVSRTRPLRLEIVSTIAAATNAKELGNWTIDNGWSIGETKTSVV